MKTRFAITVAMLAALLSACQTDNSETASKNSLRQAAGILSPNQAILNAQEDARRDYDKSVTEYRTCLAANQSNARACEGQKNIMDANERVLSATMQRPGRIVVQGQ
jgi:hypothetical protein